MIELPVQAHLEAIYKALLDTPSHILLVTAETAAGKSTGIPPYLLKQFSGSILMLEPRRVAALAIASRIAHTLGEQAGNTVGWRLRFDTNVSPSTRLEVMTEAILTRTIQRDPLLSGVSLVILDEFHERSIHGDLALALLREVLSVRQDLYVLIMSASIDPLPLCTALSAGHYHVPGKTWPVEIRYQESKRLPEGGVESLPHQVLRAVKTAREGPPGDILVFLPGLAEIRSCEAILAPLKADIRILHGSLPFETQKTVLEQHCGDDRIILSSAIAETSLTIPRVRVVIDSGLARRSRFESKTSLESLETLPESDFSALQRAGRAGREAPGLCIRLWGKGDPRLSHDTPEILRSELSSLVLECAQWGCTNRKALSWLDEPPVMAWDAAVQLLQSLEALNQDGTINSRGKILHSLSVHPRLAAVALRSGADFAVKIVHPFISQTDTTKLIRLLNTRLSRLNINENNHYLGLLEGFPDRLCNIQSDGRYQLPSGRLARIVNSTSTPSQSKWIIALDIENHPREAHIRHFYPMDTTVAETWIEQRLTVTILPVDTSSVYVWGKQSRQKEVSSYGSISIRSRMLAHTEDSAIECLLNAVQRGSYFFEGVSAQVDAFIRRLSFLELSIDEKSRQEIDSWLRPFFPKGSPLRAECVLQALRYRFDGSKIDTQAPEYIVLPNGIRRPLTYECLDPCEGTIAVLETRLQDLYGVCQTPLIHDKPILVRLLSPARRPVQTTRDIAGFWTGSWKEVRKEMRARYPKHAWPENPLTGPF